MPDISTYFTPNNHIFISGIGGVSTSALASLLRLRGIAVSGSDARESAVTDRLRSEGVTVHIGHSAESVAGATCLIRSAAIHDDNPEIVAARAAGIPVYERADAWGAIMTEHAHAICIAGTHGKTTTTGFAAQIALAAGLDPTITVGGNLPGVGTHRVGSHEIIIAESCEYCNSFLRFRPTTAVVLNIEEDHLDFFSGIEEIKDSFEAFCRLVPADGRIVLNVDDPNTRELYAKFAAERTATGAAADARSASADAGAVETRTHATTTHSAENAQHAPASDAPASSLAQGASRGAPTLLTFSTVDPSADVYAANVTHTRGRYSFDLVINGAPSTHRIDLKVVGRHNVVDALAAAASLLGVVEPSTIAAALCDAKGVARRFEYKGDFNGADVYDDYAHHPSEIAALFSAARAALGDEGGKLVAVFHPHTYSRTKSLRREFAEVLATADAVCLLPIYAAREDPDPEISSDILAADIDALLERRSAAASASAFGGRVGTARSSLAPAPSEGTASVEAGSSTSAAFPAPDFSAAAEWARAHVKAGDILLTVGAGEAYKVADLLLG